MKQLAKFLGCAGWMVLVLLSVAARAQTIDTLNPALRSRIDRIARQVLEQTGVPSASVAVVQGGKLVYTQAYGEARLKTATAPALGATPEMRYSIGSISKQFTAAAILMLAEEGKLSLDDAVGKYVPGLTRGNQVTIRQILSHTSGYQDYWPEDYVMTTMLPDETAQQILDTWGKKPLDFEPGTQWQYSNTNYVIAGRIVEAVTGEPLIEFLTAHIFRPLGMQSVWNSDQRRLGADEPAGYYRHALGPLRPAPKEGRGWMFAAGELAMTAHDLALWDESLIDESILKPASYKQMFTEVKLKNGQGTHYGLGVEVMERNGHRSIEHSGEVSGFVSDNVVLVDAARPSPSSPIRTRSARPQRSRIWPPRWWPASRSPARKSRRWTFTAASQQGRIDRSLLAPNLNDYFTTQAVADFKSSLAPLGEPLIFRQANEELRGGMTFRSFEIVYPGKRLRLTTYTYPDGKLEQYLIAPAE